MIKCFKVRLKPNKKQKTFLFANTNVSRFAYNWTLEQQQINYKNGNKFIKTQNIIKMGWLIENINQGECQIYQYQKLPFAIVLQYTNIILKKRGVRLGIFTFLLPKRLYLAQFLPVQLALQFILQFLVGRVC